MKVQSVVWSLAILATSSLGVASAQEFTARDAFWSASDLVTVAPNPAAHKASPAQTRPRRNENAESRGTNANHSGKSPQSNSEMAELVSANGYGSAPKLVRTAKRLLGLRCSIMLRDAAKEYSEVAPGTVFHSGDHIRLSLLANEPGYLYVIQQGSTGGWKPIFPAATAAADENKVPAGQPQIIPNNKLSFQFDQHAGDERLHVILSRAPIADIDRVIQTLSKGKSERDPEPTGSADAGQMVEAKNDIPDTFVKRLASRDLSLVEEETVNQSSKSDGQGEKAIYVVSKASTPNLDSQVMLSLDLRHE